MAREVAERDRAPHSQLVRSCYHIDMNESSSAEKNTEQLEIETIARDIRSITLAIRKESFVDDLPDTSEPVEMLGEKESPGPWATYYFPSRCENCVRGSCSVCGYTTIKSGIPNKEIINSGIDQFESIMDNFQGNVIEKQYGPVYAPDVQNPIGLTISPTGSFFSENELPTSVRIQMEKRMVDEAEKNGDINLVFTAEAHARDISSKARSSYFDLGTGKEEMDLLRRLNTQIILGFESRNDFVRNGIYNKDLKISDFDTARKELLEQGLRVGAFVFCGLAPMTDAEAKQDALSTVQYLAENEVFPVMMFANIQPNTITDILRANDKYKMLEPFTVVDSIAEMLMATQQNKNQNWLVPDPVGGPPDPEFNIFLDRDDTASSDATNQRLRQMLYDLRNSRNVDSYMSQLAELHKTDEYQAYQMVLRQQQEATAGKSLQERTSEMIDFVKTPGVIEAYKDSRD